MSGPVAGALSGVCSKTKPGEQLDSFTSFKLKGSPISSPVAVIFEINRTENKNGSRIFSTYALVNNLDGRPCCEVFGLVGVDDTLPFFCGKKIDFSGPSKK